MKKISLIILSVLTISSCEMERLPFSAITSSSLETVEGSLQSVTIGNYARLKEWVQNWHRLTEYPGDNVALSGTTTDNLFYNYNYQRIVTNSRVNNFWELSYRSIVGTNYVIEKITEGQSPTNDQILAENLYLRGMLYFYLTNVFGRPYTQGADNLAVPLKLTSDINDNTARATVGQLYDQIIADLLKAESLFNTTKPNIFASKESAQALLARVYLFKGDNAKAIEYANKVIQSPRFSLIPGAEFSTFPTKSPETNREIIFSIKFVKDVDNQGWSSIGSMYSNIQGVGWGEMYASRPYIEMVRKYPSDVRNSFIVPKVTNENVLWGLYVLDDNRYAFKVLTKSGDDYSYDDAGTAKKLTKKAKNVGGYDYFLEEGGKTRTVMIDKQMEMRNGYPKYFILKCSQQEGQPQLWSPIISRLGEIYLLRAEAYAKTGQTQLALDDVNTIRTRAGIPEIGLYKLTNLEGKSILEVVLAEKQLELAWEGHRKFDLYRNGLTLDRRYPGTHLSGASPKFSIAPTSNDIVEFIPETQILISGGLLVQNPI